MEADIGGGVLTMISARREKGGVKRWRGFFLEGSSAPTTIHIYTEITDNW